LRRELTELTELAVVAGQRRKDALEVPVARPNAMDFPVAVHNAAAEHKEDAPRRNEHHTIGGAPNPDRLNGQEQDGWNSPRSKRGQRGPDDRNEPQQLRHAELNAGFLRNTHINTWGLC
jgi:hypothetical protein